MKNENDGILTKVKGIFRRNKNKGIVGYLLKVKAPGKSWTTALEISLEEYETYREPDCIEDAKSGFSYRLVESYGSDKNNKVKEGNTIWLYTMKNSSTQAIGEVDKLIEKIGKKESNMSGLESVQKAFGHLREEVEIMQSIAKDAGMIANMFGNGTAQQNSAPALTYAGDIPIWFHPEAQKVVKQYIDDFTDSIADKIIKSPGNKEEDENLDKQLNKLLE